MSTVATHCMQHVCECVDYFEYDASETLTQRTALRDVFIILFILLFCSFHLFHLNFILYFIYLFYFHYF